MCVKLLTNKEREEAGMEINEIATLCGSIGVPAVMCFVLLKYMNETMAEMKKAIEELRVAIVTLTERLNK